MTQLCQEKEDFRRLGVETLVITFDSETMARKYYDTRKVVYPMVRDPDRRLYEAYRMLRGSWIANYGPMTLIRYILLMVQGWFPGAPGEDWRQMGGDVLVDPEGIVRLHYASRDPMDRPTVESLIEVIQSYETPLKD